MPSPMHQGRVAGTSWNPGQYAKFGDHRLRPALELLARAPVDDPELVFDLGCGTGEVTAVMAERWPEATVLGVDNSPQMLAKARLVSDKVAWIEADIAKWAPETAPDLVYSNATLQWLPDHDTLFPRLARILKPGGCLAVQMPQSWPMPSHRLMRETLADDGPGGTPIGPDSLREAVGRNWVAEAETYYDMLSPIASSLDIWETEYLQVLTGEDAVLEWVTATGLRPILNGLDEADCTVFLDAYRARLREAYPMRADGRTLYPFRRLFIVAIV